MLKKDDKKSKDAQRSSISPEPEPPVLVIEAHIQERINSVLHLPKSGEWNKTRFCGGLTFIVLGAFLILVSLVEIVASAFGAASERLYDSPHSNRLVSMIVLAVLAVIAVGITVHAFIGVKKKLSQPLHTTAMVLLILVVLQALIVGIAVHITELGEMDISRYLSESFYRAKDGDLTQVQLWDGTQSGLECCGLYSPEDYRDLYAPYNFPPDIPHSCCPSYINPNTTMEKEREMCKANMAYYKVGCKLPVIEILKGASITVITVTILQIIAEVIVAILGFTLSKRRKEEKLEEIEFSSSTKRNSSQPTPA